MYTLLCVEKKKLSVRHNKVAKYLFNSTEKKKNTEGATRGAEAVTRGALQEKVFLKILQTSQENNCVGVLFYEIASLQPASLLKIDSNKMLSCEVSETSKNTYFEEHLQATASRGVL